MTNYATRIYLNEIGFHASPPLPLALISEQSYLQSWYHAPARNDRLIGCLKAAVEYSDNLLSLSFEDLLCFTMLDFVRLIYATSVLCRFTTGIDAPSLDAAFAHRTANLGFYLDGLSNKFSCLVGANHDPDRKSYLWHMMRLFEKSKNQYNQIINDPCNVDFSLLFAPELSFLHVPPATVDCSAETFGTDETCLDWTEVFSESPSVLDPSVMSIDNGLR